MQVSSCFLRSLLAVLALLFCCTAAENSKYPNSITLSYEFIGDSVSAVTPLATILYDPRTLKYNLASWTPPTYDSQTSTTTQPTSGKLLRILLCNGSSTVTSLSAFDKTLSQRIDLRLSSEDDGSIFSASVSSVTPPPLTPDEQRLQKKIDKAIAKGKPLPKPTPKTKKAKKEQEERDAAMEAKKPSVKVNFIPASPGPVPKLNTRKPPQVDAEGREVPSQDEQPEKSFFQKYWWVFLLVAVMTMAGGGGDGK